MPGCAQAHGSRYDPRDGTMVAMSPDGGRRSVCRGVAAVLACLLPGCSTMRGVRALRDVDFEVTRVTDVRVAGVPIGGRHGSIEDPAEQAVLLGAAALSGHLPLECKVLVRASNPPSNPVTAELVRMDWTLLLDGRKAVGGRVAHRFTIPPGESAEVPV